jgi:hypothetical protein
MFQATPIEIGLVISVLVNIIQAVITIVLFVVKRRDDQRLERIRQQEETRRNLRENVYEPLLEAIDTTVSDTQQHRMASTDVWETGRNAALGTYLEWDDHRLFVNVDHYYGRVRWYNDRLTYLEGLRMMPGTDLQQVESEVQDLRESVRD